MLWAVELAAAPSHEPGVVVQVQPTPSWVPAPPALPTESVEASGGVAWLYEEYTNRFVGKQAWRHVRAAFRVTSAAGSSNAGERTFQFVPPHERLIIHSLEIQRGDQRFDHAKRDQIRVLQREEGLTRGVYDGERTAVVVLPDLRVGDVVAYDFSIVGAKPVFQGHRMVDWGLQSPTATGSMRLRVLSDRPLQVRQHGGAPAPRVRRESGLTEYFWEGKNLRPSHYEPLVPAEHDVAPWIQFSTFETWAQVADWGRQLFQPPRRVSKQVQELVDDIATTSEDPAQRVVLTLRRVQDDVRYLSLAFADSTHRPNPPELVMQRRFGDCKDKSLLMVTVLRQLGLDAHVTLVHSSQGRGLPDNIPSIHAFNHAIVSVVVEGRRYFVDPTDTYQRGRLSDVVASRLHWGLLLAPEQRELTPIPQPDDPRPTIAARMTFQFDKMGGPITLTTAVVYTGDYAEGVRAMHAQNDRESFSRSIARTVLDTYPSAVRSGLAELIDNERENEVTVSMRFDLPKAWAEQSGVRRFALFPPWMRERLITLPADRKQPLAIEHPLYIVQHATIVSGDPIPAEATTKDIDGKAFTLSYAASVAGNTIQLHHEYKSIAARLEPEDFAAYRQAMEDTNSVLEYNLWKSALDATGIGWPSPAITALAIGWLLLLVALVVLVQRRQPYLERPKVPYDPQLGSRRGWLILLGFGVTIAPLRLLAELKETLPPYARERWQQLTEPASPFYHSLYAPVLTVELLGNLLLLVGTFYLAYLYWARRRSFPLVFVVVQLFSCVFVPVDAVLGAQLNPSAASIGAAAEVMTLIPTMAWILYVLHSRRVKAVFLPAPVIKKRKKRKKRKRLPLEEVSPVEPASVSAAPPV